MAEIENEPITVQVDEPFALQVDAEDLKRAVKAALMSENRLTGEVTVVVTDDESIRALNRQYRDTDEATDVLSFGAAEEEGDKHFIAAAEAADYLGDIVIAYPFAARQADFELRPVADELRLLAIHGTLHLLGYDHAEPEEEAAMWARQDAILNSL